MTITPDIRTAVESLDPDLPIYDVMSMQRVITRETWTSSIVIGGPSGGLSPQAHSPRKIPAPVTSALILDRMPQSLPGIQPEPRS